MTRLNGTDLQIPTAGSASRESKRRPGNTRALATSFHVMKSPNRRLLPDHPRDREQVPAAARAAANRVNGDGGPWPLVFLGAVGTGKTCAALCLADHVLERTEYHDLPGWGLRLDQARAGRLETDRGYAVSVVGCWSGWAEAGLGIIDEIGGRERVSDAQRESLLTLLGKRAFRPSIYISNLTIEQLADVYDDRIASRLAGGTVVVFDGPDRRLCRAGGA